MVTSGVQVVADQPSQEIIRQAEAAASSGDKATATHLLGVVIDRAGANRKSASKSVFLHLGILLYELGQHDAAEQRIRQGLAQHQKDFALHNLLGVVLKNKSQYAKALEVLAMAEKIEPRSLSPKINRGNIYIALQDGVQAAKVFKELIRLAPKNAEYLRLLGIAYRMSGNLDAALGQFELVRRLDPRSNLAWLDMAGVLHELGRHDDAIAMIERGLAAATSHDDLMAAKARILRAAGRHADARAYLESIIKSQPEAAWAYFQLGRTVAPFERAVANQLLQDATRLAPSNVEYIVELADSLDRTRGVDEANNIERAYQLARRCLQMGAKNLKAHARVLCGILDRSADYDALQQIGDFAELGHFWALSNQPSALLHQLARVKTAQDRRLLVEHHQLWGRSVEAMAARLPIKSPKTTQQRARIRIGFMSSDLRDHPVSYFVMPFLEGYDRSRFEVFCYSWSTRQVDKVQKHIESIVDVFRWAPRITARDAAQMIADDELDILFELGGTTDMNKLEAMAWRLAPIQVSWLGYPHSSGLSSIDHILVDPYIKPKDPALLIEQPFEVAHSWVVLGQLGFNDRHVIEPGIPEDRHGRITFGTMNNPSKYRPETLSTWADIVHRTEGSRFLFVRPEGGAPSFRENIWRAFEAGGVSRDRVEFIAVRGSHMPHYNAIDIALDTFPQTGGTTTCESLWMGVPVVTLVGEAFFERLSYSNLSNAGLGDLCAFDRDSYIAKAVELAADRERRHRLRAGLRAEIGRQPLGRADLFVDDLQRAVERLVRKVAP